MNLLMNNFLRNRKSVRDFKDKKMKDEMLGEIKGYCNQLRGEIAKEGFEFLLFEDGERIYKSLEGIGGYAGVMIKSPHYIGLNIKDNRDESLIYGAYFMENLITKLTDLNIGSCWISLKGVDEKTKKDLFQTTDGNIDYLLAIGHPVPKNPFVGDSTSSRIGVEDIVFKDEIGKSMDLGELESRGLDDLFYYIRFAPSSHNKQPWRFILKDDRVVLLLAHSPEEKPNLADAGIIMYYFENLAQAIGIDNRWNLLDNEDYYDGKIKYKYIGEFGI